MDQEEQVAEIPQVGDRRRVEPLRYNPQFLLAIILTLGVLGMWAALIHFDIPQNNHDIILGLLSSVTTAWIGAMTFFFGSNNASKAKDASIAATAAQVAKPPEPKPNDPLVPAPPPAPKP